MPVSVSLALFWESTRVALRDSLFRNVLVYLVLPAIQPLGNSLETGNISFYSSTVGVLCLLQMT